jgi:hypothetical protein
MVSSVAHVCTMGVLKNQSHNEATKSTRLETAFVDFTTALILAGI